MNCDVNIFDNKYKILGRNSNIIVYWILILIITLLIFLNIAFNYRYYKFDNYVGYIKNINGEYSLIMYIEQDHVSNLYNYNLLVNSTKYTFKIKNISSEYYIIDGKNCYEVILSVNLKQEMLIENNILNITFQKNQTTIYKEMKEGIKKWIN